MDGLPVRQWRKQPTIANVAPQKEAQVDSSEKDTIWRELPMPKGSELYPPWSQALLRAARAGRIVKPPPKPIEDDKEGGEDEDAEGELDTGFLATKWSHISREAEQPEPEFLAKRRKGLPTLYGGTGSPAAIATLRKTKVRKTGNDGNTVVLDVLVPEGVIIEGEVAEGEDVTTQTTAPGTFVEGIGVANADGVVVAGDQVVPTPQRRRPPPPKRKPKGPGRGRKKKVVLENGPDGTATAVDAHSNEAGAAGSGSGMSGVPGEATREASGDVGGGDEGSEDDEDEGEEGDDMDREEGELTDTEDPLSRSATPSKPPTKADPSIVLPTSSVADNEPSKPAYLAPPSISVQHITQPLTGLGSTTTTPMEGLLQPNSSSYTGPSTVEPIVEGVSSDQVTPGMTSAILQSSSDVSESFLPAVSEAMSNELPLVPPAPAAQISSLGYTAPDATNLVAESLTTSTDVPIPTDGYAEPSTSTVQGSSIPSLDGPQETTPSTSVAQVIEAVSVEAPALLTDAEITAELPAKHNPLEGLAAPQAGEQQGDGSAAETLTTTLNNALGATETAAPSTLTLEAEQDTRKDKTSTPPSKVPAQDTAKDDDIFGSLERHLDSSTG